MKIEEFVDLRYGMFVHFGLYSILGRCEWVMNREEIPREEYRKLADQFHPDKFDADALADLAVEAGMRYIVFTTMHHDGFRMYDTDLTDFCSTKTGARRDYTAEVMAAAKKRGLKFGLYHSLNNWMDLPDGADALESRKNYDIFIQNTHERIRELATRYQPADIFWYDGWWPFYGERWKATELDAMIRSIQPNIIINGRHGLAGDFATPEGHLGAPDPWRPWEACITLNKSWGYSIPDQNWKPPAEVISMLATCAAKTGNLLLNIGPRGDGVIPQPSVDILRNVGAWLKRNGEAIYTPDRFTFDLRQRGDDRSDWHYHGQMTANGNSFYVLNFRWRGSQLTFGGVQSRVKRVSFLDGGKEVKFTQTGTRLQLSGMPDNPPDNFCTVLKFECEDRPFIHQTGGMRIPNVPHPQYDPGPSDILSLD